MALVSKTYAILMELTLRLTSTLNGMGHRGDLGSSHVVVGDGLITLFSFNIGLTFLILCLIIS